VKDPCAVFEAVSREIVGTKQQRFGPSPSPEVLVSIREVVRNAIESVSRIPILIPWGGSKQGPGSVDVAELMAFRQIDSLLKRIESHHPVGVDARIRLEDATDYALFADFPGWREKTDAYVKDFSDLATIVLPDVLVIPETQVVGDSFKAEVAWTAPIILNAMLTGDRAPLAEAGWSGRLPDEQIDYYLRAYANFYPNKSQHEREKMVADYFAAALVRKKRDASGFSREEATPIVLSFTPPIPGAGQERRSYVRTIPERYQSSHRAPWLSKGYVKIRGNEASPATTSWAGGDVQFVQNVLHISGGGRSVSIAADYSVVE
jgi:hypothetical protein